MNRLKIFAILLLSGMLCACATPKLNVKMVADAKLNTGPNGESFAVVVRLYQLTSPDAFKNAEYQDLWKIDQETLSGTMLAKEEHRLEPGANTTVSIQKLEETRYIGVFAMFRDAEDSQFKAVKKVNYGIPPGSTELQLSLVNDQIELQYR